MLDRLFATSLQQLEGLKVFDSQAFFKHLDSLKAGTFQSKAAKDFIEIASGFNKLFNQDAKLAQALKSTTGEQVGSSIATSVWGAVQYQITKFAFALMVRTMPYIPFFKGINSKVSAAALRYHIKAALNKSASVQDFKIQLNHLVQRQDFDNATKALIREIEGGLPPDDGGGGALPSPKDTPISGGGNKPPKGNDEHMGKEGNGGKGNGGETRPYVVIEKQEDKESFIKSLDLSASATPIPANLDVEGFLKTLEGVKNHKNFIEHLADHKNGKKRLSYLNLVEPTLKTPSLKLVFKDPPKTEYIKSFVGKDGQHLIYILITKEDDRLLITGIPDVKMRYIKKQIRDASLIHSFTSL
ncbi:hypothetical protein [Helicobacter bizzozeronii]|uniref:hypothetical protein n=1 Tax=Helicobacter bizzozeronii TaxID=56877 RepID=UPI0018F826D6|nr:hypothetical protein [Helicobacter bizzozeronii]